MQFVVSPAAEFRTLSALQAMSLKYPRFNLKDNCADSCVQGLYGTTFFLSSPGLSSVTWSVLRAGCHSEILQPASCALTCLTLADVFLIVLYNFYQISFGYRLLFLLR